jgi:hypothetical protein
MTSIAEWSGVFLYNHMIAGSVGGVASVPAIAPRATGDISLLWPVALVISGAVLGALLQQQYRRRRRA